MLHGEPSSPLSRYGIEVHEGAGDGARRVVFDLPLAEFMRPHQLLHLKVQCLLGMVSRVIGCSCFFYWRKHVKL